MSGKDYDGSDGKAARIISIDAAKGIGILLVVYAHIILITEEFFQLNWIVKYIYAFHMPLFFFVSGFCMRIKIKKLEEQPCKVNFFRGGGERNKLLNCYIVWSLIYFLLAEITYPGLNIVIEFWSIVTFRGIAPVWFLGALYLCEKAFYMIGNIMKRKYCAIVFVVFVFITFLLNYFFKTHNFNALQEKTPIYFGFITVCRFFPCAAIFYGGYIYNGFLDKKNIPKIASALLPFVLLTAMAVLEWKSKNPVNIHTFILGNTGIFFLTSLMGTIGILSLCESFPVKWLAFIGKYSLGIMLLHYVPFPTVAYSVKAACLITDNIYFASVLSLFFTVLICGAGMFILQKKAYVL